MSLLDTFLCALFTKEYNAYYYPTVTITNSDLYFDYYRLEYCFRSLGFQSLRTTYKGVIIQLL